MGSQPAASSSQEPLDGNGKLFSTRLARLWFRPPCMRSSQGCWRFDVYFDACEREREPLLARLQTLTDYVVCFDGRIISSV